MADHFDALEQRISTRAATVAVVGQGYVGLTVASAAAVDRIAAEAKFVFDVRNAVSATAGASVVKL